MATQEHEPDDDFNDYEFEVLSREEALEMFDGTARRYLNMSGEEFLRRYQTGDFEDPDSFEVIHVGMLVPLAAE